MSTHITADADYTSIVKNMADDLGRTAREREIEAAFGESIPDLLERLAEETDGNRTEMLRRVNDHLRANAEKEDVPGLSRGTLYNYIEKYNIR